MSTKTDSRRPRLLTLALPTLALTGGVGALSYLRRRWQHSRVFLPDRYPNGVWEPEAFGLSVTNVWFDSRDGTKIHGWWMPHPSARGTFLFCHGNTGSIAHRIGVFRHLQRLKVNLLAFDYRGYGKSGGSPSEAGLFQDVRAAHEHLVEVI